MFVIISKAMLKKKKIYHRAGCIYAKRILPKNYVNISIEKAEKNKYRECSCCKGLAGEVKAKKKCIRKMESRYNLEINYKKEYDTLYIKSQIGFWKIYLKEKNKKYVLYHLNVFNKEMPFNEAIKGYFHKQRDVKEMQEIDELIKYIGEHDRAKLIIMDDYRKLPQNSKKEKKYYRQVKIKEKKKASRRLFSLFEEIEKNNPEYKKLAMI